MLTKKIFQGKNSWGAERRSSDDDNYDDSVSKMKAAEETLEAKQKNSKTWNAASISHYNTDVGVTRSNYYANEAKISFLSSISCSHYKRLQQGDENCGV
ncbi:hypothetical protein Peur_023473 [Populus x canadensis]